jgi:branched-chain amino acid transport system substrate-binding protein
MALLAIATVAAARAQDTVSPQNPRPYRDFREQGRSYSGPGRERAEPTDVREVLIGYFGPSDHEHLEGGDLWKAASLAVERANAQGGFQGKPFRLVSAWSDQPWKTGAGGLARLVYHDRVWAIVGGIDGATAHLAEQVVAKARLPLVCPASSDRTANVANVPWMFSVLPGNHLQAPLLAHVLAKRVDARGFTFVSAQDHDSRIFLGELERALKQRRLAPRFAHILPAEDPDERAIARSVVSEDVAAVVVSAGCAQAARLVPELRTQGFRGLILGDHRLGRRRFVLEAGAAADGVLLPLLCNIEAMPGSFCSDFEKRYRVAPDYAAAHAFDSVSLAVAAIRKGGLNRARIGDALRSITPFPGATGMITWDNLGSNTRPVALGLIRGGRVLAASCDAPLLKER